MTKSVMTIFHLSDVHIGETGVRLEDFQRIIDEIESESKSVTSPLLLVTGDLTTEGLQEEFEQFYSVVSDSPIRMVIVPGNHDERNYGASHFERLFGPRHSTYSTEDVAIYAADSAEPDNDAGHVSRAYYPTIRDFMVSASDKIRVFALHHHLVPVPHTGREHSVVEDAGDVLGLLDSVRCNIVLNGHRHVPWIWQLNGMIIYNGGTLLSRRTRGAGTQGYTRIEISRTDARFTLIERSGKEHTLAQIPIRLDRGRYFT